MASRGRRKHEAAFLVCMLMLLLSVNSAATFFGIAVSPLSTASAVPSPIFGMTLIIPQGDPVKVAWSELLCMNLRQLGIDCKKVYLNMSDISRRVLAPDSSVLGRTYDEGGFDAIILGYQLPVSPDPYLLYHSSQFAPKGVNYYLWNDTNNDALCSSIRSETNATKRPGFEKSWQLYAMDWLPSVAVFYANGSVVLNASLDVGPFEVLTYPVWPAIERWSGNLSMLNNAVVLAQPGNSSNLIPLLSASYFDSSVMNPIYGPAGYGLFQLSDMQSSRSYVPCIARNWTTSSDYKNWTIDIRNDVFFHDGVHLTGVDVNFTLRAYLTPALGSPLYPLFADVFGSNNSVSVGANNLTVEIRLAKPYAYIMDLLSVPILPKHILGNFTYDKWSTLPFNTGVPSDTPTYYWLPNGTRVELTGPVGAGPYRYAGYNKTTQTYHLERYNNYFNRTRLEASGLFQVQDYYVKTVSTVLEAARQFQGGNVTVLDSQYHFELTGSYFRRLIPVGKIANFTSLSVQEVGFNMRHPILGVGTDTPIGRTNSSSAAEAAKHVRKAIAYAIPRQAIITSLLGGYGLPARTSVFCPLNEGYDQTIPFYEYNLTRAAAELRLAGYEPASIVPGFWESYGTAVLVIAAGAIGVVAFFTLWKTKWIFKVRKPKMT